MEIVSDACVKDHSGKPVVPLRWVLVRDPKPQFRTQAFLCTDRSLAPEPILASFVHRWQRGPFSLVTLWADRLRARDEIEVRQAAWYVKERATFFGCAGVCAAAALAARRFLHVGRGGRQISSRPTAPGALRRHALLCRLMDKVDLSRPPRAAPPPLQADAPGRLGEGVLPAHERAASSRRPRGTITRSRRSKNPCTKSARRAAGTAP